MSQVITEDGDRFDGESHKLIGSVASLNQSPYTFPPKVGEYPVFVEQVGGCYVVATHLSRIKGINQ